MPTAPGSSTAAPVGLIPAAVPWCLNSTRDCNLLAASPVLGTKVFIDTYTTSPLSLTFQGYSARKAMESQGVQQIISVQLLRVNDIFNLVHRI